MIRMEERDGRRRPEERERVPITTAIGSAAATEEPGASPEGHRSGLAIRTTEGWEGVMRRARARASGEMTPLVGSGTEGPSADRKGLVARPAATRAKGAGLEWSSPQAGLGSGPAEAREGAARPNPATAIAEMTVSQCQDPGGSRAGSEVRGSEGSERVARPTGTGVTGAGLELSSPQAGFWRRTSEGRGGSGETKSTPSHMEGGNFTGSGARGVAGSAAGRLEGDDREARPTWAMAKAARGCCARFFRATGRGWASGEQGARGKRRDRLEPGAQAGPRSHRVGGRIRIGMRRRVRGSRPEGEEGVARPTDAGATGAPRAGHE